MQRDDYCFDDPRLVLVPIEHLTPDGVQPAFAGRLHDRAGWSADHLALFDHAFSLYWNRSAALAARLPSWPAPRLRHIAIMAQADSVYPYAQILNTSSWLLYASDFDPACSHPEFAAYLLIHGDRMAVLGEVTTAALHNAPYWFERSDPECAAFAAAAHASSRPDAGAFRALADATAWLRKLSHETLRPPPLIAGYRAIPRTGLWVRKDLEAYPPALVSEWTRAAKAATEHYHTTWRATDARAVRQLTDWLAATAPPLLVVARNARLLWDPASPTRIGSVRNELRHASGIAVRDVLADLDVVAARTRTFLDSVVDPGALPPPDPAIEQRGYVYLDRQRRLIAYNIHEPDIDRLHGPALPYARCMLGARTIHEWAHLATDAGWVPQIASPDRIAALTDALAIERLAATVSAAPRFVLDASRGDLHALVAHAHGGQDPLGAGATAAGRSLTQLLLTRMPDYQANLLAQRYLTLAERETYVRQNIRTLRPAYSVATIWRMLVRYLYEYQYLRFSSIDDARPFFLRSTWFDSDFFASGLLDEARFDRLTAAVAALCDTYAVDEGRFRTAAPVLQNSLK